MSERSKTSSSTNSPASPRVGRAGTIMRGLEWGLAALGALYCVGSAVMFSAWILSYPAGSGQELWPLPGFFFLEISLLGLAGFLAVAANRALHPSRWSALPWTASGILATFVVLGGFSIGPALIPGMLAFLIAGIFQDIRQHGDWPRHFMLFMLAALLQGVIMFSMVFIQQPNF